MAFIFQKTEIAEVVIIESNLRRDNRGFFTENYRHSDFEAAGIEKRLVQLNHSFSEKNVIRGLHFQRKPLEQGKLVSVTSGKIMDVAVDIRVGSETFKKWVSVILSGENCSSIWIPEGFAHGFLALEDSHVIYLTTNEYSPKFDSGIRWNDPDISINWIIESPIVSEKDRGLKSLRELIEEGAL